MGVEYTELPGWEFTAKEVSPGQYRVRAVRQRGITGESGAVDPETALKDLQQWARAVPTDTPAFGGTDVDALPKKQPVARRPVIAPAARALIDCVPQTGETTCTIACLGIDCRCMEAEYVRGHLGTMILAVLWGGPAHGYGVGAELKRRSDDQLEVLEGSLYPALHRLEEAGWVESEWETNEGRRRRSYSLTADGKDELRARGARWTAFRSFMDSLLKDADA